MDEGIDFEQTFAEIYDELRRIARDRLARSPGNTLQATALVHEAYLKLAGKGQRFHDEQHLLAVMATAMRRLLIDRARRRKAQKRGGDAQREVLDELAAPEPDEELLALDDALQLLAVDDPLKAQLVELRYFAGLTGEQAAEALGISPATADRHWAYARAWLQARVRPSPS